MPSRRATLQATLPLLAGTLSGCTASAFSDRHPRLNCLELINVDTKSHTVYLRVEYENEEILSDSYTIDGREDDDARIQQRWIPQEWPDETGQFRVHFRMDTRSEWVTIKSEEELGEYAIQIAYRIDSDGHGIPFGKHVMLMMTNEVVANRSQIQLKLSAEPMVQTECGFSHFLP